MNQEPEQSGHEDDLAAGPKDVPLNDPQLKELERRQAGLDRKTPIRTNRAQVWLARTGVLMALIMILVLKFGGFGGVQSAVEGEATIYRQAPGNLVFHLATAAIFATIGATLVMRPERVYAGAAAVVFLATLAQLALTAPTSLCHRVVVTPDHFYRRTGFWFAPDEHLVRFDEIGYVQVAPDSRSDGRNGPSYVLECIRESDGEVIAVPLGDLMKEALPQIFSNAIRHEIVIGERSDGWQIPPDLLAP